MPRQKDVRDYSAPKKKQSDVTAAAAALSESLPGEQRVRANRVNPTTGSPVSLAAENMTPAAATPTDGALIDKAMAYVQQEFTSGLGFSAGETPEYVPDPHVQQTSSGSSVVHLHQQYHGVPAFEMTRSVKFTPDNNVERVVGDNASFDQAPSTTPLVNAVDALRIVARYLAENQDPSEPDAFGQTTPQPKLQVPAGYTPRVLSVFDRPSRPTVLDQGPFGKEVNANLVFLWTGDTQRLCWKLVVTMPDLTQQYLVLVAADKQLAANASLSDTVLLCQPTGSSATGMVFLHNPGNGNRQLTDFPCPPSLYPVPATPTVALPNPFPASWWLDANQTSGNCSTAVVGTGSGTLAGTSNGNNVTFNPANASSNDQNLLNGFFFCNYMHDFFYMLGFDEAAGNFQKVNFGTSGAASDAVLARVHPAAVSGTANMLTPADGQAPLMNLGMVTSTNRHTALDSDVVFHEYVHGVTNRLVGGRMNSLALQQPQSRGMGEGWGDYFALTIQNHNRTVEKVVTGDWVVNSTGGIRSAPYDTNYPNTYRKVGTAGFTGEHRIGEIWCATLMQMNRNLDAALGAPGGHQLAWQIVVDGLKLAPANPSFLDARDAILQALVDMRAANRIDEPSFLKARKGAWQAFAKFGMGENASTNGASLSGIQEDMTVPAGV